MNTFNDDYKEYIKNVPRFFPKFTAYKNPDIPQPAFNFKAGLKSEKRTLQAFFFVTITMLIIRFIRGI